MKTVNFLEALEANKTKRVRVDLKNKTGCAIAGWLEVAELREKTFTHRNIISIEDIESSWQVEPEIIEFEAQVCATSISSTKSPTITLAANKSLMHLHGKLLNVTVKVIE